MDLFKVGLMKKLNAIKKEEDMDMFDFTRGVSY